MTEILSLWKSPLDKVGLREAIELVDRQPRAQIVFTTDFSAITVYNYGTYGASPDGSNASANDGALVLMFQTMSGASPPGGMALIEQIQFQVNAQAGGYTVPDDTNVVATGTGGEVKAGGTTNQHYHFVITGAGNVQFFSVLGSGHTSGGTFFRGLAFHWMGATSGTETCILADQNTWNTRAVECNFVDCPVAFNAQGLSGGLERCTIQYNHGPAGSGPSGFASVVLSGSQCFVTGPAELTQLSQKNVIIPNTDPPTNTCGISFADGLEHGIVSDLHINHFSYGITYAIASGFKIFECMVSNVEFSNFSTCVYMKTTGANGKIYGQKYVACVFTLGDQSPNVTPLVYIDAGAGDIFDVNFLGCTAFQSNQHGYQIVTGSNIHIIGGTSSGNGPNGGAGVAITGNCGECVFSGVNLDAQYPIATTPQSQQWAFLCSGSPTKSILLDGCSMIGYPTRPGPVSITGHPTDLKIINCPGYNNQNTIIASGTGSVPTIPVTAATASTLGGSSTNYFGPSLVIFTNGASSITFTANNVASTVPPGAFVMYYVASPYDAIQFSAAPATFTWIGK